MLNRVLNILAIVVILYILVMRGPAIYRMFRMQGEQVNFSMSLPNLEGTLVPLPKSERIAYIIWATWCPPCTVELARINDLIKSGTIKAESFVAISVDENFESLKKEVEQRGYLMPILHDRDYQFAKQFKINGTPGIVLLDESRRIKWVSVGASPSLEFRLKRFFKKD